MDQRHRARLGTPLLDGPDPTAGINVDADLMSDLRADLAVWRAVANVAEASLRPAGQRTIGAPGAHRSKQPGRA